MIRGCAERIRNVRDGAPACPITRRLGLLEKNAQEVHNEQRHGVGSSDHVSRKR